jgi:hypothetical protein
MLKEEVLISVFKSIRSNYVKEGQAFQFHILELLDSNLSSETGNPEIFRCIFQPHQTNIRILKSEVLTAVSMENIIF